MAMSDSATLAQHAANLRAVADQWTAPAPRPLLYDRSRQVYATPDSTPTYRSLYGRRPYRWARSLRWAGATLRQGTWPTRWAAGDVWDVPLPVDAVVMPRKQSTVVVASAAEQQVLKVSAESTAPRRFAREQQASALAETAGVSAHVPHVHGVGEVEDHAHWLSLALLPNHTPFFERRRKTWQQWLRREGLPVLQRLYAAGEVEERPAKAWHARLKLQAGQAAPTPHTEALDELLQTALADADSSVVLTALTHGDLTPIHVHRTRNGWGIIDWANFARRPLWLEFLVEYLRYPASTRYGRPAFWQWLRGDLPETSLPSVVQKDLDLYLTWVNTWHQTKQTVNGLRYQVLLGVYASAREAMVDSRVMEPNKPQVADSESRAIPEGLLAHRRALVHRLGLIP